MANASAKKAASARQEAQKFYLPLVGIVNGLFVLLRVISYSANGGFSILYSLLPHGWFESLVWLILFALQYYCYVGILDQAATAATSSGSNSNNKNGGSTPLVGGVYLDWLALTFLIQYVGGLLWKLTYYGLFVFPVWGAYSLYATMYSNSSSKQQPTKSSSGPSSSHSTGSSSTARTSKRDNTSATASRRQQRR